MDANSHNWSVPFFEEFSIPDTSSGVCLCAPGYTKDKILLLRVTPLDAQIEHPAYSYCEILVQSYALSTGQVDDIGVYRPQCELFYPPDNHPIYVPGLNSCIIPFAEDITLVSLNLSKPGEWQAIETTIEESQLPPVVHADGSLFLLLKETKVQLFNTKDLQYLVTVMRWPDEPGCLIKGYGFLDDHRVAVSMLRNRKYYLDIFRYDPGNDYRSEHLTSLPVRQGGLDTVSWAAIERDRQIWSIEANGFLSNHHQPVRLSLYDIATEQLVEQYIVQPEDRWLYDIQLEASCVYLLYMLSEPYSYEVQEFSFASGRGRTLGKVSIKNGLDSSCLSSFYCKPPWLFFNSSVFRLPGWEP